MLILNFGHPLTDAQLTQLGTIAGRQPERVIDIAVHIAHDHPLAPQTVALADAVGLDSVAWQTAPLVVNLPGYMAVTACLLAEIEGRCGHLPAIIKLRPVADSVMTEYEVAEIINLQALRNDARTRR